MDSWTDKIAQFVLWDLETLSRFIVMPSKHAKPFTITADHLTLSEGFFTNGSTTHRLDQNSQ